jgi:hypothetical protein
MAVAGEMEGKPVARAKACSIGKGRGGGGMKLYGREGVGEGVTAQIVRVIV